MLLVLKASMETKYDALTPVECNLPNAILFLYLQFNKINIVHVSRCGLLCVSLVF